ncbi:hypothetical protein VNI00_015058 [Paramarasmius palmivorus]|uniref:Sodefrin-like factor n=1 Tax=Paramarasmius palmivorus TaxID=297713 RepID=A0AAW0BLW1_9AGAR
MKTTLILVASLGIAGVAASTNAACYTNICFTGECDYTKPQCISSNNKAENTNCYDNICFEACFQDPDALRCYRPDNKPTPPRPTYTVECPAEDKSGHSLARDYSHDVLFGDETEASCAYTVRTLEGAYEVFCSYNVEGEGEVPLVQNENTDERCPDSVQATKAPNEVA